MTTIKGTPQIATNFDKISNNMNKTADNLKESARQQLIEAGKAAQAAGVDAADVIINLAGAGANAVFATSKFVEGIGDTAAAGAHVAAAGGYLTAGVGGWAVEGMRSGGREVAKGAARGFGAIANSMTRIIGDGKNVTVRELQGDPTAQRFSERMFGKAAGQLQLSSDSMNAAWNAYGEALWHLSGVGGNLVLAAGNAAGVAGNLAKAAALTTSAGATKMAEYGVRVGAVAVQAAEAGVVGARDLMILSAKFSAATANVLANPDQGKVQVLVDNQLKQYQNELAALVKDNPGLQQYVQPLLAK